VCSGNVEALQLLLSVGPRSAFVAEAFVEACGRWDGVPMVRALLDLDGSMEIFYKKWLLAGLNNACVQDRDLVIRTLLSIKDKRKKVIESDLFRALKTAIRSDSPKAVVEVLCHYSAIGFLDGTVTCDAVGVFRALQTARTPSRFRVVVGPQDLVRVC